MAKQETQYSYLTDDLYERRTTLFEQLTISHNDIVMLGDSLINGCEWHELLHDNRIKNRGINGDTIEGVRARSASIMESSPHKLFVMIGINDVSHERPAQAIGQDIMALADYLHTLSPSTRIYIHSLLPFDSKIYYTSLSDKESTVTTINRLLQESASKHNYTYIELYSHFVTDGTAQLAPQFTNDGLHLTGEGYALWSTLLAPYITE